MPRPPAFERPQRRVPLPRPHRGAYDEPDPVACARYVISPPLRSAADRDALWEGLADSSLDLVATDHVPDTVALEKGDAARGVPFNQISNGAPGIETLLAVLYSEGVAKGRITVERMVDLLATTPARRFGLASKGAIEVGRDGDLVLFDPPLGGRSAPRSCTTPATTRRTRASSQGAVREFFVRGRV